MSETIPNRMGRPATPQPAVSDALGGLPDDAVLNFRDDVRLEDAGEDIHLLGVFGGFSVRRPTIGIREALHKLSDAPTVLRDLLGPLALAEGAALRRVLDRVRPLLIRSLVADGDEYARIEAMTRDAAYEPVVPPPGAMLRLSRFALCRVHNDDLVLESPLVKYRVILLAEAARSVAAALGRPRRVEDLVRIDTANAADGDSVAAASAELLGHLVGAGFAELGTLREGQVQFFSDQDPTMRQWEFHDLLFHSRSRTGRFDQPFGGIFPYQGEIDPQPAIKEVPDGPSIELYRPTWDEIMAKDPSLAVVMEGRRSIREYAEQPMTVRQLGEFLYRVARVRGRMDPAEGMPYDASTRPYPCGGAAYELEVYLTVLRCEDLDPGIYYYDPVNHSLVLINSDLNDRKTMQYVASVATGLQAKPDLVFTITSRFQRLSWKYRSMAYAVSLRHAGVLYQTMYLVATAMGLAPCGLGSGNSDIAGRALGLDYLRESSIGDFILGSRPEGGQLDREKSPNGWRPVNDPAWMLAAHERLNGRE